MAVDLEIVPSIDSGDIGLGIRFSQGWVMFSRVARGGDWAEIRGTFNGGNSSVDITRGLRLGEWEVSPPTPLLNRQLARAPNPRDLFHSWRLERFFAMLIGWSESLREQRLEHLAMATCWAVKESWSDYPADLEVSIPVFLYLIPPFQPNPLPKKPLTYRLHPPFVSVHCSQVV